MSVSIDGKIHKGKINVKYGEAFPIAKRSMELHDRNYGYVLVYIISLGQPKWTEKLSVEVPFKFYITQRLTLGANKTKEIEKKQQKNNSHLKVIK